MEALIERARQARRDLEDEGVRNRRDRQLLLRYARTRDARDREAVIQRFMPLATSLARRFPRRSESFEDIVQVANLGLVNAVDRYDPDRGVPFPAFATPTILGEIRRHFRDHSWTVRLPRGLQEITLRIDRATDLLVEELGRQPTAKELAARTGDSLDDVLSGLVAEHQRRTESLDAPRGGAGAEDQSSSVVDTLGSPELGYDRVEARSSIASAQLDEREQQVLELMFDRGLTQSEIGRELGISQMQVSRISRGALWRLLRAVQGDPVKGRPVAPPVGERLADAA